MKKKLKALLEAATVAGAILLILALLVGTVILDKWRWTCN